MKTSQKRKQRRTRRSTRPQPRPRPRGPSRSSLRPRLRAPHRPTAPGPALPPPALCSTHKTRGPPTKRLVSGPRGPPRAQGCYNQNTNTPARGSATKATSKARANPKAPWDTRRRHNRVHSIPTKATVTKVTELASSLPGISFLPFQQNRPSLSRPTQEPKERMNYIGFNDTLTKTEPSVKYGTSKPQLCLYVNNII